MSDRVYPPSLRVSGIPRAAEEERIAKILCAYDLNRIYAPQKRNPTTGKWAMEGYAFIETPEQQLQGARDRLNQTPYFVNAHACNILFCDMPEDFTPGADNSAEPADF